VPSTRRDNELGREGDLQTHQRCVGFAAAGGLLALIGAALVVAGLSGCATQTALALGAQDGGKQINVQKGQMLTITLAANPSTGYNWEVAQTEGAIMRQVGETEFQADSQLPGAPGKQTLRFESVAMGQMELRLVYHRPWETDVEPLETFTVQVTIR
jgi:predicted secreted protein